VDPGLKASKTHNPVTFGDLQYVLGQAEIQVPLPSDAVDRPLVQFIVLHIPVVEDLH